MAHGEQFASIYMDVPSPLLKDLNETLMEILCNPLPKLFRDASLISSSAVGHVPTPVCNDFGRHHCSQQASVI